jgi:hypothetical protein
VAPSDAVSSVAVCELVCGEVTVAVCGPGGVPVAGVVSVAGGCTGHYPAVVIS